MLFIARWEGSQAAFVRITEPVPVPALPSSQEVTDIILPPLGITEVAKIGMKSLPFQFNSGIVLFCSVLAAQQGHANTYCSYTKT